MGERRHQELRGSRLAEQVSRRTVLRWSGSAGVLAATAVITAACAPQIDPSEGADANGVVLLPGFTSRVIARADELVGATSLAYRWFPDGAATFVDHEVPGGWYLTVNHEIPAIGGVTSIRFAPDGTITGARSICDNTGINCAGGATPWGTWLTCEEFDWGHVWECDPTGREPARRHRAMGAFTHEAAAVATDGRVYLTEDRRDGALLPVHPRHPRRSLDRRARGRHRSGRDRPRHLAGGVEPGPVGVRDACRNQVPGTIRFSGGEGIATRGDLVWFSTKGDDRIWQYDVVGGAISLRYQAGEPSVLSGVDNLWIDDASGALFVAEDGGDMQVVMLRPDSTAESVIRLPGQDHSEITGPCFSPDGQRLYFSSQRGPAGVAGVPIGVTYEITGPFDELLGRTAAAAG